MIRRYTLLGMLFTAVLLGCSKDGETVEVPVDRSANLLSAGDSGPDFLANTTFDALRIEIAYTEGYRPSDEALSNLRSFLLERTFKTNIQYSFLPLPPSGEESLSLQEIATIESENRTIYNQGSTLALYIYFADAPADADQQDENIVTLGAVYRNTSMVIHEVTIRDLASRSALLRVPDVETATLGHEFGHLFGLVNLGADMVNPHEDPEAANHCSEDQCLMQAQLEFTLSAKSAMEARVAKGLSAVPDMGVECIRDLAAIGGRPAN